ncbi:hypothetical protein NG796_17050 [Laspinema sp. A4]|uniref:hypothetical protein n=1 Tax=Laspinema sp. D2d TaxID=2953686 RepID=UPI0021BBA3B1|nr:hypothetical protein [Laspinema sp. D2d]MCT7984982.1 hypothetical protein [Laspinema sp. D2d]
MNEFIDRNGRPLKGAALQARLTALQRQEFEQKARHYLETHPIDWSNEIEVSEKIPILVALNNLLQDYSTHNSIISLQTIEPSKPLVRWGEFPLTKTAKAIGYALAIAGGSTLFFLIIRGGATAMAATSGASLGAGVALVKLFDENET